MERKVFYQGKQLTSFDWVGMRDQDVESASRAVKECFKEFPTPMPPQPRLLFIARILSAYVRQPLVDAMQGKAIDPIAFPRDAQMENDIVVSLMRRKGLDYVDKLFRREQRRIRETSTIPAPESKPAAEETKS